MEGENERSLLGEHALVIFVKSMQAARAQMREQWGLDEKALDVMGSGGAAGLNSKYIIS